MRYDNAAQTHFGAHGRYCKGLTRKPSESKQSKMQTGCLFYTLVSLIDMIQRLPYGWRWKSPIETFNKKKTPHRQWKSWQGQSVSLKVSVWKCFFVGPEVEGFLLQWNFLSQVKKPCGTALYKIPQPRVAGASPTPGETFTIIQMSWKPCSQGNCHQDMLSTLF